MLMFNKFAGNNLFDGGFDQIGHASLKEATFPPIPTLNLLFYKGLLRIHLSLT